MHSKLNAFGSSSRSLADWRGFKSRRFSNDTVTGQVRSPGDLRCTGRPVDTICRTWRQMTARLLADLCRPQMYGATGRHHLQHMGPQVGQITGRPMSPGEVRGRLGDTIYKACYHGSGRPVFWPATRARGWTGERGTTGGESDTVPTPMRVWR